LDIRFSPPWKTLQAYNTRMMILRPDTENRRFILKSPGNTFAGHGAICRHCEERSDEAIH
jgi:hypothetical protein